MNSIYTGVFNMNEMNILTDLLEYKIMLQKWYNHALLSVVNPEAKALFTRLRDDETRDILNIQQKLLRKSTPANIIHKIFPAKPKP
ncbi:hypothetical protein Clst_2063 [Thermoclostridium stercorarium subsp. stercorarium DSM 8532]|nr:hypothetical protein Clst_2063 [Thermoclostridium stercorarium subsp. stercorarium DSM 8532]